MGEVLFKSFPSFDVIVFREHLLRAANESSERKACLDLVNDLVRQFPHSSQFRCLKSDLTAIENGRTKEDQQAYLSALELDPLNAYAYESLGHISNTEEELAESESWFRKSIAARQEVNAYIGLIDVLHQQGNRIEAQSVADELDSYLAAQTVKADEARQKLN